jgi:hypothetical protein
MNRLWVDFDKTQGLIYKEVTPNAIWTVDSFA